MARNNPVTQILVTSGNAAPLAAGSAPSALAVGQVGLFSANTNLSVDGTALALCREFYIAVGVNDNAGGSTLYDVKRSAGQYIQSRNITNVAGRCYTPAQNKIIDVTDFAVKCDSEYGIKVNLMNQTTYSQFGFNQAAKIFMVKSNCCADSCTPCADGDTNDVANQLVTAINNDPDGWITASFVDYTTTPGTPIAVSVAGYAAWVAANTGDNIGIRLTINAEAIRAYTGEVNMYYDFPRGTDAVVSLIEGFDCNGTITEIQGVIFQQGSGYDVAYKEWYYGGHNGTGNYRQSELNGNFIGNAAVKAASSGKYYSLAISYDQESVGGWEEYKNNMLTIVAIPCGETTTIAGFLAMIDRITAGRFDAQADDAAACPVCTSANEVHSSFTVATDGVG